MISFLKGRVERRGRDFLDLDVGGVGYRVLTSISTIERVMPGDVITLFTHLAVREDALSVFGFIEEQELELFKKLITVSGVGPKIALGILSAVPVSRLCGIVMSGDIEQLIKVPGVGKKTGQRIILELKDKLSEFAVQHELVQGPDNMREAAEALVSLGFDMAQVNKALAGIGHSEADTAHLIKLCLKRLKS